MRSGGWHLERRFVLGEDGGGSVSEGCVCAKGVCMGW